MQPFRRTKMLAILETRFLEIPPQQCGFLLPIAGVHPQ